MLGDFLNFLVKRRRRLDMRVLTWDYPVLFSKGRELSPIYGFGWRPQRRVRLRYDDHYPVGASQHQKIVIIDDELAFCRRPRPHRAAAGTRASTRADDPRASTRRRRLPAVPRHRDGDGRRRGARRSTTSRATAGLRPPASRSSTAGARRRSVAATAARLAHRRERRRRAHARAMNDEPQVCEVQRSIST